MCKMIVKSLHSLSFQYRVYLGVNNMATEVAAAASTAVICIRNEFPLLPLGKRQSLAALWAAHIYVSGPKVSQDLWQAA